MKKKSAPKFLPSSLEWNERLLTLLLALFAFAANAQVGVGTTSPDPSAQLEVQSTTKGTLISRMLDTERAAISNPATGLLVYQTNGAAGFYFFDGSTWQPFMFGVNTPIGFTATKSSMSISASSQIVNYAQLYADGAGLNTITGTYTVPVTGRYHISAVVNYSTATALSVGLGAGIDPRIALMVNNNETLTGFFPILNVNIVLLLTLRVILGSGTVVIAGDVPLVANDVLDLRYIADGLNVSLNFGGVDNTNGIVWSVRKL